MFKCRLPLACWSTLRNTANILIVYSTGISIVYYLDMIYLTVDRLVKVVSGLRYSLYWNEGRAKRLILATWCLGIVLCITFSLLFSYYEYHFDDVFYKYVYPTLGISFTLVALLTYNLIFRTLKESNRKISSVGNLHVKGKYREFKKHYFVPALLISTFLLFMVIPALVYIFVGIIYNKPSQTLSTVCWISYALSNLVDAVIYIFFLPDVRALLLRMINSRSVRKLFKCCGKDTLEERQTHDYRLRRNTYPLETFQKPTSIPV